MIAISPISLLKLFPRKYYLKNVGLRSFFDPKTNETLYKKRKHQTELPKCPSFDSATEMHKKKKNPTFWQYSSDSLDRKHQQQKSSKKTKKLEMKNSKKLETQHKLLKTDFFHPGNETTPRAGKNQIFWRKSCVSGTFQSIGSIPNSNRDFPMDIDERETSVKREDFSC